MNVPFTQADFFRVLTEYNLAVWPSQLFLVALAVGATLLAFRSNRWADRSAAAILGVLWLWMGVVYHWGHFTSINRAAWLFGALFVLQGVAFLVLAFRSEPLRFAPALDTFGLTGAAFMAYGLVFYPLVGAALGHTYPAQPTLGLPCPTTIFTVGLLLWARPRVHPAILVVPVLWSLVGMNAAWLFGVREDFVLPVAGIVGGILVLLKNRREARAAA